MTTVVENYLSQFTERRSQLIGNNLPWLQALRDEAYAYINQHGFPSSRDEEWKYTKTNAFEKQSFQWARKQAANAVEIELPTFDCYRLVFVDGYFDAALSSLPTQGVDCCDLATALQEYDLEAYFKQVNLEHSFTALNTLFLQDGVYLKINALQTLDKPIHIIYINSGQQSVTQTHVRNIIVAEQHSKATIIESYICSQQDIYFNNAFTQIITAPQAVLNYYKIHRESTRAFHMSKVTAHIDHAAQFNAMSVVLSGLWLRSDSEIKLRAERAQCQLNGLYVGHDQQHIDHHTSIDHQVAHTQSMQCYKGVLDHQSRGVFNGKVLVRPQAQHADATQINKNLLLSKTAEVDTKPQLEIFADDVKCSHGATVGQLDDDALFYLRSRGIDAEEARKILVTAFAKDILQQIPIIALREWIERNLQIDTTHT